MYRQLMRLKPDGISANAWAVRAGVSRAIWADLRRHGNPSRRTLERLLSAAGSSLAEFEALRADGPPMAAGPFPDALGDARPGQWPGAPLPPIPLVETRPAGEWRAPGSGIEVMEMNEAQVVGQITRPASLAGDRNAYAVAVLGDAMWPRFRPGRILLVSPAAPVAIGDDVLAIIKGDALPRHALIKELVRRSAASVELRQFTPDTIFTIEAAKIASLHRVVGEAV